MKNKKNYMGFHTYSKSMANFEAFRWSFSSSTNLLFLKSEKTNCNCKNFQQKKRWELDKKNPMSDVIVQVQLRLKSVRR